MTAYFQAFSGNRGLFLCLGDIPDGGSVYDVVEEDVDSYTQLCPFPMEK